MTASVEQNGGCIQRRMHECCRIEVHICRLCRNGGARLEVNKIENEKRKKKNQKR